MLLRILKGVEALAWLARPSSEEAWRALWTRCPYGSPYTDHGFVLRAYRTYAAQHEAVLVLADGPHGALDGAWALAASRGQLLPAGGAVAREHGWLAMPLRGSYFAEQAVLALAAAQVGVELAACLPLGAPVDWAQNQRTEAHRARLGRVVRRIISLDAPRVERALDDKTASAQLARLRRAGAVELVVANSPEGRQRWLELGLEWAEARRAAVGLPRELEGDPERRSLSMELAGPGPSSPLQVSALRVGGRVLSVIAFFAAGARIWVEQVGEEPAEEAAAPSLVHWLLLEERLRAEGRRAADVSFAPEWLGIMGERCEGAGLRLFFTPAALWRHRARSAAVELARRALGTLER